MLVHRSVPGQRAAVLQQPTAHKIKHVTGPAKGVAPRSKRKSKSASKLGKTTYQSRQFYGYELGIAVGFKVTG